MDPMVCLEYDIRRVQTNKETVLVIFFDIEKAYDMLWKKGLLIKLKLVGIKGRVFNWCKDFLTERNITVKVNGVLNRYYKVENGTPQGSIIIPLLFSLMINDVFKDVGCSVDVDLFADDGVMWKKSRNVEYVVKKMQQVS